MLAASGFAHTVPSLSQCVAPHFAKACSICQPVNQAVHLHSGPHQVRTRNGARPQTAKRGNSNHQTDVAPQNPAGRETGASFVFAVTFSCN